ncbi:RNase adapter RapZ [Streptomyces sp. NPDC047315]|uniref:RapZ C-terminal domain-containing protein n=1 Tax=Streptomyces sp. NPDC047315 TaxID=3155142 RepID=UPI0033F7ACBA
MPSPLPALRIVSFGYGHRPAPTADITLDLRRILRNPHQDPALRELTGLDEVVLQHVLTTPGAIPLVTATAAAAAGLVTAGVPLTVAVGCVGGRHRAVGAARAVAAMAGPLLKLAGAAAALEHRDVHQPLLPPAAHR